MNLEKLQKLKGESAEYDAQIDYETSKKYKDRAVDTFNLWLEYHIIRNNNRKSAIGDVHLFNLKRDRPCWPTKEAAERCMTRINDMIKSNGGSLTEGFHIMRVYEENGDWYISRFLKDE